MKATFKLSTIAGVIFSSILFAQADTQIENITVVGSVNKTTVGGYLQPRAVDTIDLSKKQSSGAAQLDAALTYENGINTQVYGGDTDTSYWFVIRGQKAGITLDGLPTYNSNYTSFNPNLFGFDKIEIVRGPDSFTAGNTESGGTVNLIAKRPTLKTQGLARLYVGTRDNYGLGLDYNKAWNQKVQSRMVFATENQGGNYKGVSVKKLYIAPSITFRPDAYTFLTLSASYTHNNGKPTNGFLPIGYTLETKNGKLSTETNLADRNLDNYDYELFTAGYEFNRDFGNGVEFYSTYKGTEQKLKLTNTYYSYMAEKAPAYNLGAVYNDTYARTHAFDNRLTWNTKGDGWANSLVGGYAYTDQRESGKYGFGDVGVIDNVLAPVFPDTLVVDSTKIPFVEYKFRQHSLYLQDLVSYGAAKVNFGVRQD